MKFSYKFSNLLGAVYHKGNLLFTQDGSSVISPVGNRITIYDLKNNKSTTLSVNSNFDIRALDLSPNGLLLMAVNGVGELFVISMISKVVLHRYNFKGSIKCIKFSPDGKHFAAAKGPLVFIFSAPGLQVGGYNPFVMERVFHLASTTVTHIEWSFDSRLLAVGSADTIVQIYSMQKWQNLKYISLSGHSSGIIASFFEKSNYDIYTLSRNGRLCIWECSIEPDDLVPWEPESKKERIENDDSDAEDDVNLDKAIEKTDRQQKHTERNMMQSEETEEPESARSNADKIFRYKRLARHFLKDNKVDQEHLQRVTTASYHQDTRILVVGFAAGTFLLYEMPDVNIIHSLRVSTNKISSIVFNRTGDWIALGCPRLGQLLVWEWQSETYVMKQQAHSSNMNSIAYSPDGQYVVTGGNDGKVKLWNTMSGFCSVTFQEHASTISGVLFSHNRKFVVSASLDGTVRAYDLARYRNFKTLTSPRPVQFSCLAIDASDEFLAAGGQDVFEIYLWSVKLGKLLEILSGHEGPVVSLAFSPSQASTELASVSWDKTLKIWNAIENGSMHETIQLTADGLCVTYNPNGQQVAVATLDGQISFFDCKTAQQTGYIEGRNDLGSGRCKTDLITAKKSLQGKAFTTLCYSADGTCILAGGHSKNVCIYNIEESILLKKFEVTQNRSLDGVDDFVNKRKLTEFGNLALVEKRDTLNGASLNVSLPGVRIKDATSRNTRPEIRVFSLQFSPTGQAWAAATTEGLLIYSLDVGLMFDPFELELGITSETVIQTLEDKEYARALMMALKLNEKSLIQRVIETIPYSNIELTILDFPDIYIERTLKFIASELESTRHIHFYLLWIETILTKRGTCINTAFQMPVLLTLQKNMQKKYDDLSKICDFNQYTISYIKRMGELKAAKCASDKMANGSGDESDSIVSEELHSD